MANSGDKQDWHSSKKFNDEFMDFHNKYARQPDASDAKEKLEFLKGEIKRDMDTVDNGMFTCKEFKYKGSTYEGVKIMQSERDCPEFDLDFVIKGGNHLVAEKSQSQSPWHKLVIPKEKSNLPPILIKAEEHGVVNPEKLMRLFRGSLSKCAFVKDNNIILRHHGPAVQMDVPHPITGKLWFQVDLAPAFNLKGNDPNELFSDCYVAKSPPDDSGKDSCRNRWYRSYSTDEKRLLDRAGGQRKVVLRILKAMRANSSQLKGLQTYHLKTALFHVMDKFPNEKDWDVSKTGERVVDVLNFISSCVEKGHMNNYFNNDFNILNKLNSDTRVNLTNNISRLTNNEIKMSSFLHTRDNQRDLSADSISLKEGNE